MLDWFRTARGVLRSLRIYYGDRTRAAAMDRLYAGFVQRGDLVFDIGAHVGGISGAFKSSVPIGIPGPLDRGGSAIGGGQIGYNWQFNPNWMVGIEGDISAIDVSASTAPLAFEEKWMSTLRGRIGYTWDRYLLYFTGGVGWTHVKATSATGTASGTPAGVALGGGLEAALPWPQWTARGEFLYVNVPLDSYQAGVTRIDGGSDNYIGRFGLNYRF